MVHDATRELAIQKMRGVLGELVIEGIETNIDFQYQIINHEDYIKGKTDTDSLKECYPKRSLNAKGNV